MSDNSMSALTHEAIRRVYDDLEGLAAEIGAMVPDMPVGDRLGAAQAVQNGCHVYTWKQDDVEHCAILQPAIEILYHRKLRELLDDPQWRPSDGAHRTGP